MYVKKMFNLIFKCCVSCYYLVIVFNVFSTDIQGHSLDFLDIRFKCVTVQKIDGMFHEYSFLEIS